MSEPTFYVGDPWFIEDTVVNEKTGLPAEPAQVDGVVYKPSEWDTTHERPLAGANGKVITLAKLAANKYETAAPTMLTEAGIWRAVLNVPEPFTDVQPVLITVKSLGEL